jgi:transcriptional regulator with XRE-family HTH domain
MDVVERLRTDFRNPEYRHIYDEGFLNSSIATQIKVLREERGWTQSALAEKARMNQSRISELEDVNFGSWTIRTLRKLARAFDLRLKISFEEFGGLLHDFRNLNRQGLSRRSFNSDPEFLARAGQRLPLGAGAEQCGQPNRQPLFATADETFAWTPGQFGRRPPQSESLAAVPAICGYAQ